MVEARREHWRKWISANVPPTV